MECSNWCVSFFPFHSADTNLKKASSASIPLQIGRKDDLAVKRKTMRKKVEVKKKRKMHCFPLSRKNNFGTEKLMKAQSSVEVSKQKEKGDDVEDGIE
ncbi:hypothetical protein CEXT_711231 [Caerostris extrusa]|uniref:Uncharacterized protein n=1 Tax=Caerostris extrusa TaxID=172846 RepID=A0AAV4PSI4_CAEEX|nr:hypothetical protein CEXT_711231 [Caerostris extrusa]